MATGTVLVLDVDPRTRTIIAHAHDGIREYVRAAQFRHDAVPWLVFERDEVFADLDVLERR